MAEYGGAVANSARVTILVSMYSRKINWFLSSQHSGFETHPREAFEVIAVRVFAPRTISDPGIRRVV